MNVQLPPGYTCERTIFGYVAACGFGRNAWKSSANYDIEAVQRECLEHRARTAPLSELLPNNQP